MVNRLLVGFETPCYSAPENVGVCYSTTATTECLKESTLEVVAQCIVFLRWEEVCDGDHRPFIVWILSRPPGR